MAKAKGSPKTGGRKKGTPNFMTRELKEICRQEAPTLVKELIRLVTSAGRRFVASGDRPAGYPLPLRGQPNSAAQQPRPLSRALLTRTAYRFHARFVTVRDEVDGASEGIEVP